MPETFTFKTFDLSGVQGAVISGTIAATRMTVDSRNDNCPSRGWEPAGGASVQLRLLQSVCGRMLSHNLLPVGIFAVYSPILAVCFSRRQPGA